MKAEMLKELAELAGKDAIKHGFGNGGSAYRMRIKAACEVAECVEAYRRNRFADLLAYDSAVSFIKSRHHEISQQNASISTQYIHNCKDTVQDEMADVAILLLGMTYHFNIPIEQNILDREERIQTKTTDLFLETAGLLMDMIVHRCPDIEFCVEKPLVLLDTWMRDTTGQDLVYWIEEKMEYNKHRPYLHGNMNDKTL